MKGYYYILNQIRKYISTNGFTNTVTDGDLFDVDLSKQSIFPLAHIIINNASINETITNFNISILFMDVVDITKQLEDNENDILDTQFTLISRFVVDLLRGSIYDDFIRVEENATVEPFIDRFENKLAGWTVTFDLQLPNDMTIC